MKQIKTLTVNGERYQITDPTAARMDEVVQRLCPAFRERGPVVQCAPVAGQPLTVTSHIQDSSAVTLRRSGKNILDIATAGVYHSNYKTPSVDMRVTENGVYLTPLKDIQSNNWGIWGLYLGKTEKLKGKTITLSAKVETTATITTLPWTNIACTTVTPSDVRENPRYGDGGYIGNTSDRKTLASSNKHNGYAKVSYTVTGEEPMPYIAVVFQSTYGEPFLVGEWTRWSDIQVEIGDTATAYEPYHGEEYTAEFGKTVTGEYDWATGVLTDAAGNAQTLTPQVITAGEGVNVLYSDTGDTTVAGSADPVAVLEKLTNAIIALGGNV